MAFFKFSPEEYDAEAVAAAAYKFTGDFVVEIAPADGECIGVSLNPKPGINAHAKITSDFPNEVLDQQVRLNLEKRCGAIRDTIFEFAFSPLTAGTPLKKKL